MRWCPGPDSKFDDDALGYLLEGAIVSADSFAEARRAASSDLDIFKLLKGCFANDLVIAIWPAANDEVEWVPIKGGELLSALIGGATYSEIKLAGIPCIDEHDAKSLLRIAQEFFQGPGALEVKH
jgi:hypothetical protein